MKFTYSVVAIFASIAAVTMAVPTRENPAVAIDPRLSGCLPIDGSVYYAFISTNQYEGKAPSYAPYGSPVTYVLLKSQPNPASMQAAGWSFLASIPETSSYKFDGGWPGYLCRVDSAGVATLLVAENYPAGSKTAVKHAKGLQWDPKGAIGSITGATGTGGWSLLDSEDTMKWEWTSPAVLGIINSQPTLIYVEEYVNLIFATQAPTAKVFAKQSTSWALSSLGSAQYIDMLEYGNGKLYVVGTSASGLTLTTIPLTTLGSAPSPSVMTTSTYPTGTCRMSHYFSYITLVGGEIYGLCTSQSSSHIYRHNGQSWLPPIVLPSVPWSTPGAGRFFRTQSGEVWGTVQDYKSTYIIKISGNTASWDRSGPVVISENFGIAPETVASTTSSGAHPSNTNNNSDNDPLQTESGGGIGGGAIGGIVAGVIVVALIAAFFVFKSRKARNIKNHTAVGGETKQNQQQQQQQQQTAAGGEPPYPPLIPPKDPTMSFPVSAYPHVVPVPVAQYPFVYNDGTQHQQQFHGYYPPQQVTGAPVHVTQPYYVSQPYPNQFPATSTHPMGIPPMAQQTSSHHSQPAPVSVLSMNTKGIDIPVSTPVDSDISVSSPTLSTTASTLVNVTTQLPAVPSHSRPDTTTANNPQYRPE
ncbi:hypothetical protein BGZ76_000805 [Entomortierella beljakovae]|nr:hypothetical protein BGZ76_000805 [Entomortierella beljakovae]